MNKETNDELIITPETKIYDLLEAYPQLEDKLISIAPVFSKLKNPVLRKTITRVTSLKQAAAVGNVTLNHLINELRKDAGQFSKSFTEAAETECVHTASPTTIKETYDACNDLENGAHPLAKVMGEIQELSAGECYLLITPFLPAPLIEKVKDKGFNVKSDKTDDGRFNNFIWK